MAQAVLLNTITNEVENVGEVGVPEPVIPDHSFIYATTWASVTPPNIGQLWSGDTPATFKDPTITQMQQTVTIDVAKSARESAIDALVKANADYDAAVAAAS